MDTRTLIAIVVTVLAGCSLVIIGYVLDYTQNVVVDTGKIVVGIALGVLITTVVRPSK